MFKYLIISLAVICLLVPSYAKSVAPLADLYGSSVVVHWANGDFDSLIFTTPDIFYSLTGSQAGSSARFGIFDEGSGTTGIDPANSDNTMNALFELINTGSASISNIIVFIRGNTAVPTSNDIFSPPYGFEMPAIPAANYAPEPFQTPGAIFPDLITVTPNEMKLIWSGGNPAGNSFEWEVDTVAVPEPATYLLLGTFLLTGLALKRNQGSLHLRQKSHK